MATASDDTRSPALRRTGWILSGLALAFLTFDTVIKFTGIKPVLDSFTQLGFPTELAVAIGVLELLCVLLYTIPRTAVLGGLLMTGYLGGATVLHLRVGNPTFSHLLFPAYVGLLLWGGLYLREARLRALLPARR